LKYLYYYIVSHSAQSLIALDKLTKIQRMRKARRKTTRTPAKPEGIVYRRVLHIVALPQLLAAHLLLKGRHVESQCCRSCM
jgi:hypothetical protein